MKLHINSLNNLKTKIYAMKLTSISYKCNKGLNPLLKNLYGPYALKTYFWNVNSILNLV